MKKYLVLAAIAVMMFGLFTSCSSGIKEVDIPKIGVLQDVQYATLTEQENYKFFVDDFNSSEVCIKLSFSNPDMRGDYSLLTSDNYYLEPFDEALLDINNSKFTTFVIPSGGTTWETTFTHNFGSEEEAQEFLSKVKGFKLYVNFGENASSNEESSVSTDSASEEDPEITALLDDFEAMVKEYDTYATNLKKGNVDTQSATNIAMKVQKLQTKVNTSLDKMSPEQTMRFTTISGDMAKIAMKVASASSGDINSINGMKINQ